MTSQALNTLTNLAVAISVAHVTSPANYGAWAIVYAGYALAIQISRALIVTPMLIHADVDRVVPPELARQVRSASLAVGLVASALMLPVVIFVAPKATSAGIAVIVGLPLMLVQDTMRNEAIRSGVARRAVCLDLVWALSQGAGIFILRGLDSVSAGSLTAVWVIGASVGALGGLFLAGSPPSWRAAVAFSRAERHVSLRLLAETLLGNSVLQLLPAMLALTSGLVVAGAIRASQTVLGVTTFAMAGLAPLLTTAAARRSRVGAPTGSLVAWSSGATVFISLITGALVITFPETGRALAGNSWPLVRTVLLPVVIFGALRGPMAGAASVLRGRRLINEVVALRLRTAAPALCLPLFGGGIWGLEGAAWGMAGASLINTVQCLKALRHVGRGSADHPVEGQDELRA